MKKKVVLVTGYAGFIGYHLTKKLISENNIKTIYAIDNFNNYYDKSLKVNRHKDLVKIDINKKCQFLKFDIKNFKKLSMSFKSKIDCIFHLAAQAGINYSLENPKAYLDSNIIGFYNILEFIKSKKVQNLIYASTSSVYGNNSGKKIGENDNTSNPLQLYSASKVANEVMANAYSNLYNFNSIGLRFFTVYGPWGRPDMAIYKFTKNIINKKNIYLNKINSKYVLRDFTYIDDVIKCIILVFNSLNKKKQTEIYNIGNGNPVNIKNILNIIQSELELNAKIKIKKLASSEMNSTFCDISKFLKKFSFRPDTNIENGIKSFIDWYKKYHIKN